MSDRLRVIAPATQPPSQLGKLCRGLGGQRCPCRAGSQAFEVGKDGLQHTQTNRIGHLVQPHPVPLRRGVGPVGANGDSLDVGGD